jgi:hypothetical protein
MGEDALSTRLNTRRVRTLGGLAVLTALVACSSGSPPASRSSSTTTSCPGQAYVDVRNNLEAAVDVYGYVGSTATFLGSVPTGVHRLPLFQPVGYIYASRDGRRVSSRRGLSSVTFTHGCDRS